MLRDFVLELVAAPGSGATITLPGTAPSGRLTWAAAFGSSQQFVFYVLDNSLMQEWGVGQFVLGAPSTIIRPTVVLGNSAGTTARLNFTTTARCYSSMPALPMLSSVSNAIGRNLLHNGLDRVQQRGAGPWTVAGYTADRWFATTGAGGGTRSVTIASLADAARTAIGDEEAAFALQYVFSGGSAAGDYDLLFQRIESVRRTAGKTVTVSFWAAAVSGTPKVGVALQQVFGTGGSPSATVQIAAQTVTLSTTWTRYSVTFAVPTIVGKTLGTTAGTDFLEADLWLSSGATFNTVSGSIGVQAATISFFGRQLEIGGYATPLEKLDIRNDLANCQRFYQVGQLAGAAYAVAATAAYISQPFPVQMRGAPMMAVVTNNGANTGALTWAPLSPAGVGITLLGTVTATGTYTLNVNYTATADL